MILNLKQEFKRRLKKETAKYIGTPVCISGGIDSGVLAAYVKPRFAITVDVPGGQKYGEIDYAKKVAKYLGLKLEIVTLDASKFDEDTEKAVKAIGRPIPHFNIFPLYEMYKRLYELGEKEVILGDGPDETMCGYARNLIMAYMYKVYDFEAFKNYESLINKVDWLMIYERMVNKDIPKKTWTKDESPLKTMNQVDIDLMRPDMDDMSNGIAKSFEIKNIRPYQDNPEFDRWQFNLPDEAKIYNTEYGKYLLRLVASEVLPDEIAWRKTKMGGPVYPVNLLKDWDKTEGQFGKKRWMEYQEKILESSR